MTFQWLPHCIRGPLLNAGAFSPAQVSAVSAWLRVAAGTTTGQGYSSVPDVLTTNPAVQGTDARRPLAATSANSLPIVTFERATVTQLSWPVATNNNSTQKWGFACWVKMATNGAYHCLFNQSSGAFKAEIYLDTSRRCRVSHFGQDSVNYNGRDALSPVNSLSATGTWFFLRVEFDGTQATEATRMKIFVNEVAQTLTFSNVGTGGTPVLLRSASGNGIVGNYTDNADGTYALDAQVGPNIYVLNDVLSAAQGARLMAFEQPT